MSSRTNWTTKPAPAWFDKQYPKRMTQTLNLLLEQGRLEWRRTGKTHFAVRAVGSQHVCLLTASASSDNPVYSAKWRSALRRWNLDNKGA